MFDPCSAYHIIHIVECPNNCEVVFYLLVILKSNRLFTLCGKQAVSLS